MTNQLPAGPTDRLASERVVVQAPMSYTGATHRLNQRLKPEQSTRRLWALLTRPTNQALKITVAAVLIGAIPMLWMALGMVYLTAYLIITAWYLMFGLLLVPYRLLRRGDRKRKLQAAQHREALSRKGI